VKKGTHHSAATRQQIRDALRNVPSGLAAQRELDNRWQHVCPACKIGNCLACDGGGCRCVCALELDQKAPRRRVA